MSRALSLYFLGTYAYGLTHGVRFVQSCPGRNMYTTPTPPKHLLWTDQLLIAGGIALCGPFAWPVMLRGDLTRLECRLRGKRLQDYLPDVDG